MEERSEHACLLGSLGEMVTQATGRDDCVQQRVLQNGHLAKDCWSRGCLDTNLLRRPEGVSGRECVDAVCYTPRYGSERVTVSAGIGTRDL